MLRFKEEFLDSKNNFYTKKFFKSNFLTKYRRKKKYNQICKDLNKCNLNLIDEIIGEVFDNKSIEIHFGIRVHNSFLFETEDYYLPVFYLNDKSHKDIPFPYNLILMKLTQFFYFNKKFPSRSQLKTYFERVKNNYRNFLLDEYSRDINNTFMKNDSEKFDLTTMGYEIS